MNPELEPLSLRILSALLNGGYQGLLLTGLFWLGLRLRPRINAATRHAVGLVTLLLVAALPLVHFLTAGAPARPRALPDGLTPSSPVRVPIHGDSREPVALPAAATGPTIWRPSLRSGAGATTGVSSAGAAWQLDQEETKAVIIASSPAQPRWQAWKNRVSTYQPQWRAALSRELSLGFLGLWIVLAALRLGKLSGECWLLRSLKCRGAVPPEALDKAFGALCRQMRIRRKPRLLVVPGSAAPMAVGYRNPAVVIPANLLAQSAGGGLEPILRHELAHLRRGDDWSNLIQQLLKAVLFFHPGIWWLSRRLTLDREIACDDHVLATARAPKAYALLLTEFAGQVQYRHCPAAPAGWSRHSQLKERITMILDPKRNASPQLAVAPMGTLITAVALLAAVSLSAAPRLELAESSDGPANPDAAPATIRRTAGAAVIAGSAGTISASTPVEGGSDSLTVVHTGPRQKPMPIKVEVPLAPLPALAPVAGLPPRAPHAPPPFAYAEVDVQLAHAGPHPVPPTQPGPAFAPPSDGKVRGGEFMEQRIERLERMIKELMEAGAPKSKPNTGKSLKSSDQRAEMDPAKSWEFKYDFKQEFDHAFKDFPAPEIAEIARQAQREAQRAVREASRMAEEAKRANRDAFLQHQLNTRNLRNAQSWEVQRQVLEAQRQAMEEQMNQLSAQIQRLEEERNRIEQERDRIEARVEEQAAQLEQLEEEAEAEESEGDSAFDHEHDNESEDGRVKESPEAPREKYSSEQQP
jgi:beta-lactamase regulating signal transducer with metallopeptidase domain